VGRQQCCAGERRGSALDWLWAAGDCVTEGGTNRKPVSLRPQGTKGMLQSSPLQPAGTSVPLSPHWCEHF